MNLADYFKARTIRVRGIVLKENCPGPGPQEGLLMSYDLEIRFDDDYSQSVPYDSLATFVGKLPKVNNFVFEDKKQKLFMNIDLEFMDKVAGESDGGKEKGQVNVIALHIPYAFLHDDNRDTEYYDRIAYPLAKHLGWKLYDCQQDDYV